MTEFQIKKLIPQIEGTASTLKDADIRNAYAEKVERFVRENSSMGENWQNRVLDLLTKPFFSPNADRDSRGSNPYMCTFLAQLGVPLIELPKLREAYQLNGDKTPFPNCYVETGLALIPKKGLFEKNSSLAEKLNSSFKGHNIKLGKGRVPNFTQLRLLPDSENDLIFLLNKDSDLGNIPNLEDYKWNYSGESGLFRAYLDGSSDWDSYDGYLENSDEVGRGSSL